MARTIHELAAIISSRIDAFVAGMRRGAEETRKLSQAWGKAGADISAAATRIGIAVGTVGGTIAKIGIDFLKTQESAQIAFNTMLGSAERARALMGQIADFAKQTPFELPELLSAGKSLLAFGTSAEEVVSRLRMLGDISSGVGTPLGELAQIFGKAQVQGRLFAEDVNQLTGRGIPVIQEFARQFGVAESEVRSLVETGRIGFPELLAAFRSMTSAGGQFAGMTEAQSRSFSGMLSTLKDNIANLSAEVVRPLFEELGRLFGQLNEAAEQGAFDSAIETARDGLRRFLDGVRNALPELKQFSAEFIAGARAVAEWLRPLMQYLSQHPQLLAALAALKVTGIMGLNSAVLSLASALSVTLVSAVRAAKVELVELGLTAKAAWAWATAGVSLLITALVTAITHLDTIRDRLGLISIQENKRGIELDRRLAELNARRQQREQAVGAVAPAAPVVPMTDPGTAMMPGRASMITGGGMTAPAAAEQATAPAKSLLQNIATFATEKFSQAKEAGSRLADAVTGVAQAFGQGSKAAEMMKSWTDKLAGAVEKAANEARLKQMERLLTGKGTAEDRAFLKEQIESKRQDLRQQHVTSLFNQALEAAAGGAHKLGEQFGKLTPEMDRFGNRMKDAGESTAKSLGSEDASRAGEAFNTLGAFLNSLQGQYVTIVNNIQLLAQALPLVDRNSSRLRILNQIEQLQGMLRQLLAPTAPFFTGAAIGDFAGVLGFDPGLQGSGGGGVSGRVGLQLAVNVHTMDGQELLRLINLEMQRAGHQRFF